MSECGHYILDSAGTRVGCHFDELGEGHTTDDYFFLVTGTSSDTDIQFLDCLPMNGQGLGKTVAHSPYIALLLRQPSASWRSHLSQGSGGGVLHSRAGLSRI